MVRQVTEFDTNDDDSDFYPESDGERMADTTVHFSWIVKIKEGLEILYAKIPYVFVAGDLLWYPVKGNKEIRRAPDAMVAIGRPKGDRGAYVQHREGNMAPQVVFEIRTPKNTDKEMQSKFDFYQKYGAEEYYVYDYIKNNLKGWLRSGSVLQPITDINNWISPHLQIKFVLTPTTLEIYHPNGRKFLTPVELYKEYKQAEQLALIEQEHQQAEQQRAQLEQQAKIDSVRRLLQMGLSVGQIAQALSVTVQEVENMR
ncbi:hypothetical protein NIES4071_74630 [Calothrix sp. NIES-4071]|nr:hypothetical protein NIES4071_74630 [Calothrix sp. NIES-4071]BAZ61738.1 hypothetical protein NIES4105_74580 [Calothrix sp. NIES-4105]